MKKRIILILIVCVVMALICLPVFSMELKDEDGQFFVSEDQNKTCSIRPIENGIKGSTFTIPTWVRVKTRLGSREYKTLDVNSFYGYWGKITSPVKVFIPDGITIENGEIGFGGSLQEFAVANSNPIYATIDGVLFNKQTKELVAYPYAHKGDTYTIPEGILSIGKDAFYSSNLKTVKIPDTVTKIASGAFSGRIFYENSLETISIPDGVTSIGSFAFENCINLKSIVLPSGLKTVSSFIFSDCESLESVTIPEGVEKIEEYAFDHCNNLTKIHIPKTVTCIERNACPLDKLSIDPDNPYLEIVGGVLIDKANHKLCEYPSNSSANTYTIPDGITVIGKKAFASSENLKEVIIPEGVTTIEADAFDYCDGLHITIPASVTKIAGLGGKNISVSCPPGSYAAEYCFDHNIPCDAFKEGDWLNN